MIINYNGQSDENEWFGASTRLPPKKWRFGAPACWRRASPGIRPPIWSSSRPWLPLVRRGEGRFTTGMLSMCPFQKIFSYFFYGNAWGTYDNSTETAMERGRERERDIYIYIWKFHKESNRFIIYIDTRVGGSIMRSNFWGREGHRLWSSWHLQYLRSRIGDTFWPRPTHIEWTRFVLKLKWGSYIPVHDDPMGKNCFNFTPLDLGAPIFRHAQLPTMGGFGQ